MKKQYIKLPTLAEAYALAEANGYKRVERNTYGYEDGRIAKCGRIVKCEFAGNYFPSILTEEECIEEGYTKLEPPTTTEEAKHVLQVGQEVWVDDYSEENARKDKDTRTLIAILPEGYKSRYITDKDGVNWSKWAYAVKVENEEEKSVCQFELTKEENNKMKAFISSLRA